MSFDKLYLGGNITDLDLGKTFEKHIEVVFNFEGIDGEQQTVLYSPAADWMPNTHYSVDDIVAYETSFYTCKTAHTSGSSFDSSKWDEKKTDAQVLEMTMPVLTDATYIQQIAQNVFTTLNQGQHRPYTAREAVLDPAFQLGDGITMTDFYSIIGTATEVCDALYTVDISAKGRDETEDEFVYKSQAEKNLQRQITKTRSSLKIGIDGIIAHVTDDQGNYNVLTINANGSIFKGNGGEVTISGGSVFIPNGAISFGDGTLNGALQAAYNHTGGGDPNPSYIHNTYISQTKVISPHVYGGDLYATGQGNTAGTNPAFYMSDGVTGSGANTEPNEPKGWLCYDKNGAGTSQEAANRVFLHSESGVALKLDAGGDMSLEADDSIYFLSYLKLRKGVNYGTAAQRDAITPENGQIFFVME